MWLARVIEHAATWVWAVAAAAGAPTTQPVARGASRQEHDETHHEDGASGAGNDRKTRNCHGVLPKRSIEDRDAHHPYDPLHRQISHRKARKAGHP